MGDFQINIENGHDNNIFWNGKFTNRVFIREFIIQKKNTKRKSFSRVNKQLDKLRKMEEKIRKGLKLKMSKNDWISIIIQCPDWFKYFRTEENIKLFRNYDSQELEFELTEHQCFQIISFMLSSISHPYSSIDCIEHNKEVFKNFQYKFYEHLFPNVSKFEIIRKHLIWGYGRFD